MDRLKIKGKKVERRESVCSLLITVAETQQSDFDLISFLLTVCHLREAFGSSVCVHVCVCGIKKLLSKRGGESEREEGR